MSWRRYLRRRWFCVAYILSRSVFLATEFAGVIHVRGHGAVVGSDNAGRGLGYGCTLTHGAANFKASFWASQLEFVGGS